MFPRTEDGVPFCWDYQIKGFFKDACSSLRRVPGTRSSKLTAFKKVIDGTIFVGPRVIPFELPEGASCGRCERPLRASTAMGERIALAASETVPAGTTLDFEVLVMNPKDAETVREWLDYGQLRGPLPVAQLRQGALHVGGGRGLTLLSFLQRALRVRPDML